MGALEALESESAWRARDAELIVGTSAGSVIGTLIAAGIPPAHLAAYSGGGSLDELEPLDDLAVEADAFDDPEEAERYRLQFGLPPLGPGSWRMILSTLRNPLRHSAGAVMCGWLPRGFISTDPISRLVERFVPGEWPDHEGLRVVACDYATGRRVAFGSPTAPPASASEAVAASCAIPGFYRAVRIGSRHYVDGGICSASNADLMHGRGLDLVIVLNPMSSLAKAPAHGPADLLAARMRQGTGRRLGHELRKLRSEGTELLVLQPTAEDLAIMGPNLMARGRRHEVIEQAVSSSAQQLRAGRGMLPEPPRSRRPATTAARRAAAA